MSLSLGRCFSRTSRISPSSTGPWRSLYVWSGEASELPRISSLTVVWWYPSTTLVRTRRMRGNLT